ncbi:hypothetical protein SAMN05444320_104161 [Streptoalloteichus hindustanus]|uniref:Uncharacterized protein n=1 Tax=Streptoalloteichus hindustanus TaxID=2017 RepID=A0A1M5CUI7_STRHI|nr:hypothetical protein SAMN05444320_104161 [Streptoalloteichus hindustanus]
MARGAHRLFVVLLGHGRTRRLSVTSHAGQSGGSAFPWFVRLVCARHSAVVGEHSRAGVGLPGLHRGGQGGNLIPRSVRRAIRSSVDVLGAGRLSSVDSSSRALRRRTVSQSSGKRTAQRGARHENAAHPARAQVNAGERASALLVGDGGDHPRADRLDRERSRRRRGPRSFTGLPENEQAFGRSRHAKPTPLFFTACANGENAIPREVKLMLSAATRVVDSSRWGEHAVFLTTRVGNSPFGLPGVNGRARPSGCRPGQSTAELDPPFSPLGRPTTPPPQPHRRPRHAVRNPSSEATHLSAARSRQGTVRPRHRREGISTRIPRRPFASGARGTAL